MKLPTQDSVGHQHFRPKITKSQRTRSKKKPQTSFAWEGWGGGHGGGDKD